MSTGVVHTEPADPAEQPAEQSKVWAFVVSVAGVAAVLTAGLGLALQWFLGVGSVPLLVMSTVIALAVGLRLPAAAPAFLQPIEPD